MKKVAAVVQYESQLNDRLFSGTGGVLGDTAANDHWVRPYTCLQSEGAREGFEIHTEDINSPTEAQYILYIDPPRSRKRIAEIRKKNPRARHILLMVESPLHSACMFESKNLNDFDSVVTFIPKLQGRPHCFPYCLPASDSIVPESALDYEQRKTAVLVSSNINYNWRYIIRILRRNYCDGWSSLPSTAITMLRFEELYSERRKVANVFASVAPAALDIYGPEWEKCPLWKGHLKRSHKSEVLGNYRFNICFENLRGEHGYISEKIFDAICAGTVPVYLGDESIHQHVPQETFVDARMFADKKSLARFLVNCPREQWLGYYEAGESYRKTLGAGRFSPHQFSRSVLAALVGSHAHS